MGHFYQQKKHVIWPKTMGASISALRWSGGSCPASAVGYIYQQALPLRLWAVLQNSMGGLDKYGAINGYSELNLVQKGMLLVMVKWRILGVLQLFHGDILWIVPSRNMKLCWLGFPPNMWLNGGM
jgi:hypothetical protein